MMIRERHCDIEGEFLGNLICLKYQCTTVGNAYLVPGIWENRTNDKLDHLSKKWFPTFIGNKGQFSPQAIPLTFTAWQLSPNEVWLLFLSLVNYVAILLIMLTEGLLGKIWWCTNYHLDCFNSTWVLCTSQRGPSHTACYWLTKPKIRTRIFHLSGCNETMTKWDVKYTSVCTWI